MADAGKQYRLLTRSDFDGLVSAVLLKHLALVDEIEFVHPKDMQDGKIEVTENDITTNLPYVAVVHLAFDHHVSETLRHRERMPNHIIDPQAPSAARVVYDHYGGGERFPLIWEELLDAVDKADSGNFTLDEVLHPEGWVLLNFLIDARTGLEHVGDFHTPGPELMLHLIDYCAKHGIDEMFAQRDIWERASLYFEHAKPFKAQMERCSRVHANLVVLDLRDEEHAYAGNRFAIYALYPQCNISLHVHFGPDNQRTVFAAGKSIFDRRSKTNIGELMLGYGGGGHATAGTCQIDNDRAETVLEELIETITSDG